MPNEAKVLADAFRVAKGAKAVKPTKVSAIADAFQKAKKQAEEIAKAEKPLESEFTREAFHSSRGSEVFSSVDTSRLTGAFFDSAGLHMGTRQASSDRYLDAVVGIRSKHALFPDMVEDVIDKNTGDVLSGHTRRFKFREDEPLVNDNDEPWTELELQDFLYEVTTQKGFVDWFKEKYPELHRAVHGMGPGPEGFARTYERHAPWAVGEYLGDVRGFTHIPYINNVEDAGSVSYIVLNPSRNLRDATAAFKEEYGDLFAGVSGAAILGAGTLDNKAIAEEAVTIAIEEDFRDKPYLDKNDVLTVGHGFNLEAPRAAVAPHVGRFKKEGITEEESFFLHAQILRNMSQEIEQKEPGFTSLPGEAQKILLNVAYNVGVQGLFGFKRMWGHLKNGEYEKAALELLDSKAAKKDAPNRYARLAERMAALERPVAGKDLSTSE